MPGIHDELVRLAQNVPAVRKHVVPLLRTARQTQDHARLKAALDKMEPHLSEAVGSIVRWKRTVTTDEMAHNLADAADVVLDVLTVEFENTELKTRAKHYLTRITNFRKMLKAWVDAPDGASLAVVLTRQGTQAKNTWQKYLEYRDEVLGFVSFFDSEIEGQIRIGDYRVVLVTSPRADWDDHAVTRLRWVLEQEERLLSRHGFGKFAEGHVLAYPSPFVPGQSGGVLAYFQVHGGTMALAVGGEPDRVLQTLTHETGHKVYYQEMTSQGRAAWKRFFDGSRGLADVDRIIRAWETYAAVPDTWDRRTLMMFLPWLEKEDPNLAMWTHMVVAALGIDEQRHPISGDLKKGTLPALDQLIARKHEAVTFLHPVTAYSATNERELFAEVFAHYLIAGPNRIPEVVRDQFHRALPMSRTAESILSS